jgi:galactose mutarotase-like enzyme
VSDQSSQWLSLSSRELTAEINPLGAQLSALRDRQGRDLLWNGDPSVWAGRAPLLFPIVGALAGGSYRLGREVHRLPRHGFARSSLFNVTESDAAGATFKLQSDAASFQVYPFHFELDVRFEIEGPTLAVTAWIRNMGNGEMPASFGFHPAFRWPLPFGRARSSHFIEFASDEPSGVRRLNADGLLTTARHPTPIANRRLALADDLFKDDVLIFDEIRSRSVTYGADDGPRIMLSYPDTPYLGLWTKPQADFVCIEPWHGVADPEGYSGDFTAKPGVFMVAAGAAVPMKMLVTFLN